MFPRTAYRALAPLLLVSAALAGCRNASTPSSDPEGNSNVPALRAAIEAQTLENARKQAELEQANERIRLLEEELVNVRSDLEFVEKQFVLFERRLTNEETKASAVSAVAEAQLFRDRLQADEPLDEETLEEVESRLGTAGTLIDRRKYTAAVYYANRAMRALNRAERIRGTLIEGDALVVAVTRANLRKGPGGKFDVIGQLSYGTAVVRVGEENQWLKVRTRDGSTGWIHSSLLH
jgi:hypothetical protein